MFGRRGVAELAPSPAAELQPEERAKLIGEAVARIETVDGADYLDGFKLPTDDQELWNPQTFRIHTQHVAEKDGKLAFWEDVHDCESTLTNADIREANIGAIATIGHPLFLTWAEVMPDIEKARADQQARRSEKYAKSLRGKLGRVLLGARATDRQSF